MSGSSPPAYERRIVDDELDELIDEMPAIALIRDRCSAGDALYVALAQRSGEPLLTTDARIARAATAAGVRPITPGVDGGSEA